MTTITTHDPGISKLRETLVAELHSLHLKFQAIFNSATEWAIEQSERVLELKGLLILKGQELTDMIKSQELIGKISVFLDSLNSWMYGKAVSKQAIYFGALGLLTGAFIGAFVGYGYSLRYVSNVSQNYLMRAIVAANTKRGIDGITLMVLKTPQVVTPTTVLIQVRAVGLDMIDCEVAMGYGQAVRRSMGLGKVKEPFILGRECSGVIVDTGSQVNSLEINDHVWAYVPLHEMTGVMSEYIALDEKLVSLKPINVNFEGAATLPYAFITFWEECVEKGGICMGSVRNRRVLIHLGASSKNDGVGLIATQILKSWGARVTISTEESVNSSAEVAQMTFIHSMKTLGAESHLIIPNDSFQLDNLVQRLFDVVINTDTPKMTALLQHFCKNEGDKVLNTFPSEKRTTFSLLSVFWGSPVNSNHTLAHKLDECRKLVESKQIVPVVAKSFLPSQYDQAFRHVSKTSVQATVGKSILIFKKK